MSGPDFSIEDEIEGETGGIVAGIDEAGRGPWAGPVVAAAVVLDRARMADGVNDSKKLSPTRRAKIFDAICASASVGIGVAEVAEIDAMNILRANDLAMRRAMEALVSTLLSETPEPNGPKGKLREIHTVIDGGRAPPEFPWPARAVVGGDGLSLSVAAASIVAKVTRDRIMDGLAKLHPGYFWETNRGYGTSAHREALLRLGVTPHHRISFKPVSDILV